MNFVITTGYNPTVAIEEAARELAQQLGAEFIPRNRTSLVTIQKNAHVDQLLIFSKQGPLVYTQEGNYFFHLSMADLRIKNLKNGKHDHMISAMQLEAGMSVLDCTLGLATDAVVASVVTGPSGKVTGVENSLLVALIARIGLANFVGESPEITDALRNIEVIQADAEEYLCNLPDHYYDIVYFDPMFRQPIQSSSNLKPIRLLADKRPISLIALNEAKRVAKKRIVLKEAQGSSEFERLGFTEFAGGKYSSVQYGIMEVQS
jgi:hypothetical protein